MTVQELIDALEAAILEDEDNRELPVEVAYLCCNRYLMEPVHTADEFGVRLTYAQGKGDLVVLSLMDTREDVQSSTTAAAAPAPKDET